MKIPGLNKAFPVIASILLPSLAAALFVAYHTDAGLNHPHSLSAAIIPGTGTIPGEMTYLQDTLGKTQVSAADREASRKSAASGDAYFRSKDYLNAKAAYQQAVSQDPNNEAASLQLRKTLDLLRSQKAQNILFDVAVASADKLFQEGDYVKAMQEYENASKLLPGDPYPKNKINEIIKIQVDMKVKDEEYAKALTSADKALQVKKYPDALSEYKRASRIKPEEKYPQDRITELTALIAARKAIDDAYNKAIALADQSLAALLYQDAIKSYSDALAIKPEQPYPKDKIKEIEGILARIANAQADYDRYIILADSLYIDRKYFKARENYVLASSAKPAEAYPKEMISKADKLLTSQEAAMANALKDKEAQYNQAVESGDMAFANKAYETSKAAFQTALSLKPDEVYPKSRIAEIDKLMAADARQKAADSRYANSIGKADSMLLAKAYLAAKVEFQNASNMKPDEVYPKNKIIEINLILFNLEKQKAQEKLYTDLIAKADKLFAAKSYAEAKAEYGNALDFKPGETYPAGKIADIDKIVGDLAALKAVDDRYATAIADADRLYASKTYDQALLQYREAGQIKPGEQYPKEQIVRIEKILADIAAAKSLDENYQAAIAKADRFLAEKGYGQARTEYANAALLKPQEQYPKTRISEIDAILGEMAKQKALEEQYAAAIAGADKLLADKSYEPALTAYQAALKLKPAEEYPKGKIGEITLLLTGIEKQRSLDASYANAIARADKLLEEKSYDPARTEYLNASAIKPGETYPQEKVAAIDKILSDIAAARALDEKYAGIIANADKLLAAKTYEEARAGYQAALTVKPAESYPAQKISAIDQILADIAAAKSLDENYTATIASADRHLSEKSYEQAKNEYVKASGLKPAEQYPVTKIAEIDAILAGIARQKAMDDEYAAIIVKADDLFAGKSYDLSKEQYQSALVIKPAEQYPKDKIEEIGKVLAELAGIRDRDEKYAAAVANADKLLLQKSYEPARTEYLNASSIKPQERYPKDKIAEINTALADIAAAIKALDDNYTAAVARGDQLLSAKSYEPAKAEFVKASELKPAEQYPKGKIAEIETALAAIAKQKAIDDEYAATIVNADKLLAEKAYEPAKTEYQKAGALKAAEQYPKTKLAEIERALADAARLKAIEDQYTTAIAGADKLFQDKNYDQAKTAYQEAGKIKPAEQYPKDKILEISDILAAVAKQKLTDDQYKAALTKGDQLLASGTYDQAKIEYANALNLKPAEQYPRDKIAEIDGKLAEMKAREDAYQATLATADQLLAQKKYEEARTEYQNALVVKPMADYPKEKIAEINKALEELLGKQKYYDNLIAEADSSFREKEYAQAKETYQQALGIFPAQPYPKNQISLITARVDSLYRANKSLYDKAISDGDRFFNTFEFDKAVDAYTEAINFLPMEKYPREMIVKIRRTIAENAIADVLKTPVIITSNNEKQFSFTPVNVASRKNNFVYIKIKNLSGKPFNVLMRYGKDKQPNGGVVMRNLNIDGTMNERLVSVRDQDLWSREDNNWISLYPQGGDVEVSFIQVSRAK